MLDVLLESRSRRPRRLAGTVASALVHATLIAAAIALAHPTRGSAVLTTHRDTTLIYIPPAPPRTGSGAEPPRGDVFDPRPLSFHAVVLTVPDAPAIDPGPLETTDVVRCDLCTPGSPGGSPVTSGIPLRGAPTTGVADEREVDRVPRLIGTPIEPRYPVTLRDAGLQGRVTVQLVVDTLGRVEMTSVQIIQSPHPLFADAVREVLARYRFAPGEIGGRRVATRVEIPFEFKLR